MDFATIDGLQLLDETDAALVNGGHRGRDQSFDLSAAVALGGLIATAISNSPGASVTNNITVTLTFVEGKQRG